jgi:hypothetical protein
LTEFSNEEPSLRPEWRLATRVAFRFFCLYFLLTGLPFPLDALPVIGEKVDASCGKFWDAVVTAVGAHVLHTTVSLVPTGSGDRLYNYIHMAVIIVAAAIGALVWSIVDRRRRAYPRGYLWLNLYVRFWLANVMLSYGLVKVIKVQFSDPSPTRLIEPVGDMSPMGLLWTFMGFSTAYTFFAGLGETVGGLLLMWRRTALLGALVVIGVMANVAIMNFAYDVPVKLFSTQLMLTGMFVAAPELRRLTDFFFFNRRVEPALRPPFFARASVDRAAATALTILVAAYVVWSLDIVKDSQKERIPPPPPAAIAGVWDVDTFEANGALVPPLATDATRWRRVLISSSKYIVIQMMPLGRPLVPMTTYDEAHQQIHWLTKTAPAAIVRYRVPAPALLIMEGDIGGRHLRVTMRRAAPFPLTSRGYHWIQERPFNR